MKRCSLTLGSKCLISLSAGLLAGTAALTSAGSAMAESADDGARSRVDFVSLGDSYASAPLVPTQVDSICLRSDNNYPSLVARATGARLTDVSCSGAVAADLITSNGTVPAQFDALNSGTDLVTVTIGGNDIGFSSVLGTCAQLTATNPTGAPCEAHFAGGTGDQITQAISETAPKVRNVLRGIRHRSPHARIVVVGYPDLFPDTGVGCTSAEVPIAMGDFPFLRDKEKELNAMLARQARYAGAEYVNTYAATVGHDLCQPTGQRWIETFAPQTPAAPVHPNAEGEKAMADAVQRVLTHHGRR